MPVLIKNGPNIPITLMNQRDDGNVVFFCGAGISMGTGLPSFSGLVDDLYVRTGEHPTALEQDLLDRQQLDKVLGLLEERLVAGRLRKEVVDRLSQKPPGPLDVHKALIRLSRTEGSVRLVTTNFDDRFECVDDGSVFHAAPALPIPKPHDWASFVHLHGRIQKNESANHLVLTAADFGRAYLTEGWAARFVTELFRHFTVVFVGYSLNDPVLSYMVDALAAERARGANFHQAYAFAEYEGDEAGKEKAGIGWRGKNVEPILFEKLEENSRDRFARLNDTLVEWAHICNDPLFSRRQIVLEGMRGLPDTTSEARVCWALSNAPTAEFLAKRPAVDRESDYPIISAWLEKFDEHGLLSRGALPRSGQERLSVPIVSNHPGHLLENGRLDSVTERLAFWIARHAHVPQVLGWVLQKRGHVHPELRSMLLRRLAGRKEAQGSLPNITDRLRLLWTVMLRSQPVDDESQLWSAELLRNAKTDGERILVENAILEGLRPRLVVRPAPSTIIKIPDFDDNEESETPPEECAHLVLKLSSRAYRMKLADENKLNLLEKHAHKLTDFLLLATDLLHLVDEGVKLPQHYRPAIEYHEKNWSRNDWIVLIDWVRDSYFALSKLKDGQAPFLLQRWLCLNHVLFKRLALHALTEDDAADIELVRGILLSGEPLGLWNEELYHELLVFLRKAGQRLPKPFLAEVVAALKKGPPSKRQPGEALYADGQHRERMIGRRLRELADSGAELDGEARSLAEASRAQADEDLDREEFPPSLPTFHRIGVADYLPAGWEKPNLDTLVPAMRKMEFTAEKFEAIAATRPCTAYLALQKLAFEQAWPPRYWERLLWEATGRTRESKLRPHRQRNLAQHLVTAPQSLFAEIDMAVAEFIERFARSCTTEDEALFRKLWNRTWANVSGASNLVGKNEVLSEASNSAPGKLGQAALHRLWKYSPQASDGLPEAVAFYFSKITSASDGRLGRVILVTELPSLFAIDPSWTREHLLPHMRWQSSTEAHDLWSAYAWSARADANLLDAFKADFLLALSHYNELGEQPANLVYLFTAICLQGPAGFTDHEVRGAIRALPEAGVVAIAGFMKDLLDGSNEPAEAWRDEILPWLKKYWPSAKERNTKETSLALVECLMNTGAAFKEAVDWATDFLRPGVDHVLLSLHDSRLHVGFPEATLDLLLTIVPDGEMFPWEANSLREILEEMKEKNAAFEKDPRFVKLRQRL